MTASSSNQKMSTDRLSALPDGILCYILSFLETKEAAITCLLSKRWRFLWTELPALRFVAPYDGPIEDIRNFVNRVNRTLAICSRHNLERFVVVFSVEDDEKCFVSDATVWIGFAVKNKVKHFILLLPNEYVEYMLPEMMYSNPSWITLSLRFCVMAPRGTIQWPSLTALRIELAELYDDTIEKIFSGCPVLGRLDLVLCWGFSRLEVNSPSFHTLRIKDDIDYGGYLEISAPYLHTLKIRWDCLYQDLYLKNMKSLVRAKIEGAKWEWADPERCKKGIEDLFGSIRHVKMLHLGHQFTKFLSLFAWDLQLPQCMTKCLELDIIHEKRSIPGILGVLESSPNLETLVIDEYLNYWGDSEVVPSSKNDLNCDLFYLTTVCIIMNFDEHSRDNSEPMLTLARILLKRAIILEEMVIDFQRLPATSSTAYYEMTQKVLSYPKLSQKAVVLFN